jgi:hypothetical protein
MRSGLQDTHAMVCGTVTLIDANGAVPAGLVQVVDGAMVLPLG